MAAEYGGIIGQEVLKAVSNKFMPIVQFLAIGAIEALSSIMNFYLKNDQFDVYRHAFGNEQVEAMHKLRYYLIGAGSIGCEFFKIL
jgi:ubiquitin-activating enzyme E1